MNTRRVLWIGLVLNGVFCGCRTADRPDDWWPAAADRVDRRGRDTYYAYDVNRDTRLDYMQRERDGYKDLLYFPARGSARLSDVVDRTKLPPHTTPLLVLLLDGVAYDRIRAVRARGGFKLFHDPARVVSTFPSLTDVAYDVFFRSGPTPGYEAGYFDRPRNELTDGAYVYLSGTNEHWVRYSDYRINVFRDAFMYLYPSATFHGELERARGVLDKLLVRGRRDVVLYVLSTDGIGHMLTPEQIEAELVRLDHWIERLVYDWRGAIDIVVLADHGNSTTPPQQFKIENVLRDAGLRPVEHLKHPGDVAVPIFGLLDIARVHTFDDATRDRVLAALGDRPEIELLAWQDGDAIGISAGRERGRVLCRPTDRPPRYAYVPTSGDPLRLADVVARMKADGTADADGFATEAAWLAATYERDFPAGPPRLWTGMRELSDERPDVAACLADGWFVGSGFLASFVSMRGTHGGLHRRGSETFAMMTTRPLASPLSHRELFELIRNEFLWEPALREK